MQDNYMVFRADTLMKNGHRIVLSLSAIAGVIAALPYRAIPLLFLFLTVARFSYMFNKHLRTLRQDIRALSDDQSFRIQSAINKHHPHTIGAWCVESVVIASGFFVATTILFKLF